MCDYYSIAEGPHATRGIRSIAAAIVLTVTSP